MQYKQSYYNALAMVISTLCMILCTNTGCTNDVRSIPPGYVGKVLTPTGWQNELLEAGQVNLGIQHPDGSFNRLVLMEATSVTVKETFLKANDDKEDHRVLTKNGMPLSVDLRVRLMLPDDPKNRNAIFALMTPKNTNDARIQNISLADVYTQFAQMEIRGKTRAIFATYENDKEVMSSYEAISDKIGKMIVETFTNQGVPLRIQSVQLSNVKVDEDVLQAGNKQLAANSQVDTISSLGKALRENPEYLEYMKWEALKEMAKSGGNVTVIMGGDGRLVIPTTVPSVKK